MLGIESRIAILLATFNGEEYLVEQLNSIKNQSGVEVFIFASDDCSSDNTSKLLKNVNDLDNKLIVLPRQKSGSASANFFRLLRDVDLMQVDYIALSDQDDIWQEDKLNNVRQSIIINPIL